MDAGSIGSGLIVTTSEDNEARNWKVAVILVLIAFGCVYFLEGCATPPLNPAEGEVGGSVIHTTTIFCLLAMCEHEIAETTHGNNKQDEAKQDAEVDLKIPAEAL
jgi:hypothetical protein